MKQLFIFLSFLSLSFASFSQDKLNYTTSITKGIEIFNVEDYGAVRIDPTNPTAAPDATAAIQSCINAAYAKSNNAVVYLPGMYKLAGDPSQVINGNQIYYQLYIPLTAYNATSMNHHSITFRFGGGGSQEHLMPMNSINGSGFYCTRIETTDRGAAVLGSEKPTSTFVPWGPWNYTNVYMEGQCKVIVETKSGSTNITNYMSGIDLNNFTQISFDRIFARTTTTYSDAGVNPPATTFGLKMPQMNNHAVLHGNAFYGVGWGTALYTGEHAQISDVLAVGNKVGVNVGSFYPAVIGNLCTEDNAVNIQNTDNTFLNIGSWNGEDYTYNSPYYLRQYDVKFVGTTASKSHITVGQFVVHNSDGTQIQPTLSNTAIDLKIQSDESGLNRMPLNTWTTSSRPTPIRPNEWGYNSTLSSLEQWDGSTWSSVGGLGGLPLSSGQPTTGQLAWIDTRDNRVHYVSNSWEYRLAIIDSVAAAGYDADAQTYINRISLQGYTMQTSEKNAVNAFVVGLKSNNLYTKIYEMWLFIGGTAATNLVGFKNVSNATFTGSPVHSANGTQFDGATQYMSLFVNPSTALTANNTHLAYYSRTAAAGAAGYYDMGAYNSGAQEMSLIGYRTGGGEYSIQYNETAGQGILNASTATDGSGFFIGSRPSSSLHFMMRNGTTLLSQTTAGGTLPTVNLVLGANDNANTVTSFSNRQYCFASVGQGFTTTDAQTYSTLVNQLQTSLGRATY